MKFINATMRPGTVIEVLDGGMIKADVPGLFSDVDSEKLPPIMPLQLGSAGSFSSPKLWGEVWVINVSDNPSQLFWIRKDDVTGVGNKLLEKKDVEILCDKESGIDRASLYHSEEEGWMMKTGDSEIEVKNDNNILINNGIEHRTVDINKDNISLGSKGRSAQSAVLGDNLQDLLEDVCSLLRGISTMCANNIYTFPIKNIIDAKLPAIEDKIGGITSNHVTLD